MNSLLHTVLFSGLLISAATAQRLASYEAFAGSMSEVQPPTTLLPVPSPVLTSYPAAPLLPPPPVGIAALGDATFNNLAGHLWYTDGMTLAAMPTPTFAPLVPVPPPLPLPVALIGTLGGPATGIAIDPLPGIMFVTGAAGTVVGVATVPGLPVVVPAFVIPFPLVAPISGLEWDGATGTLWAVSVAGVAYNFFPGGVPAAGIVFPTIPMPGPAGDIAIDKLGTLNPFGLRPLYVAAAGLAFDLNDPAPILFPASTAGPMVRGLAFLNHPARVPALPGCEGCPALSVGPTGFTTGPMSSGNAAFAVGMGGMAPGTFGLFGFDTITSPVPFPALGSCPLGLTLSPSLILVIGGPADPVGDILLPLSLLGVPVGLALQNQNIALCAALPTGFAFSRLQTITSGGF